MGFFYFSHFLRTLKLVSFYKYIITSTIRIRDSHNFWMINLDCCFPSLILDIMNFLWSFYSSCSASQILSKTKTRKAVLPPSLPLLDPLIKKGYSEYVRTKLSRGRQKGCVGYPACDEQTVPLKAQTHTKLC